MRWPFRRHPQPEAAQPEARIGPARLPERRRDWAELPPLQRAIGPAPLTIPHEFDDGLATRRGPDLFLEKLGHQVSLNAPAGLVLGIARPGPGDWSTVAMDHRHIQRKPVGGLAGSDHWPAEEESTVVLTAATEAGPSRPPAAAPVPAPLLRSLLPVEAPLTEPTLPFTRLAPQAELRPTAMVIRTATPRRSELSSSLEQPEAERVPRPRLTLGQARRLGLGAPLANIPTASAPTQRAADVETEDLPLPPASAPTGESQPTEAARDASAADGDASETPGAADAEGPGGSEAASETPDAGEIRDIRSAGPSTEEPVMAAAQSEKTLTTADALEPELTLARPPSTAAAASQRASIDETADVAGPEAEPPVNLSPPHRTGGPVAISPMAAGRAPISTSAVGPGSVTDADALNPGLPPSVPGSLPLAASAPAQVSMAASAPLSMRSSASLPLVSSSEGSMQRAGAEPKLASPGLEQAPIRSAGRASMETGQKTESPQEAVGTTGIQPLVGEHPIVPSVDSIPPTIAAHIERTTGVDVASTPVHRDEPVSAAAAALSARAFTVQGQVYMPAAQGSLQSASGQSLLAHELTHVAQQRRFGSSLPDERSAAGKALEREARQMEYLFAPSPPLPLSSRINSDSIPSPQTASNARLAPSRLKRSPGTEAPLAWAGGLGPEADGSEAIQRAEDQEPPTLTLPHKGGGELDERQLEDLAGKLYERFRGRLRHELLVDRERAGMLSDLR